MTSTLKLKTLILSNILLVFSLIPGITSAQQSLSLSVTPPLFQISAVPEQSWQSHIKIINANPFDITVYANPVNFTPIGEAGQGRFMPVLENETEGQTMAEWIEVTKEPILVKSEQSYELPFSVHVPSEPPPGGHFAAILIGTKPPEDAAGEPSIQTSQQVSSLIFMKIAGDVVEQGRVREFSSNETFYSTPNAGFTLRFENTGNVHTRPQGTIEIFNMWGKERGMIPINQGSAFGNVLPGSIRKFDFTWAGEQSFADIGRYKAVVTINYGTEVSKNLSQNTYFWVIPVKPLIFTLLGLVSLILSVRWALRSYIRHMLMNAGIDPDEHRQAKSRGDVAMYKRVSARVTARMAESTSVDESDTSDHWYQNPYVYLLIGVPGLILLLGGMIWYISSALTPERAYEASVETNGNTTTVNSETAVFEELSSENQELEQNDQQHFNLRVVNASGETGAAATVAHNLEQAGYVVASVEPNLDRSQNSSAIVTHPDLIEEAQALSAMLNDALISFTQIDEATSENLPEITIFVGKDTLAE